jgi:glutathione S-transferase
MKLYYVVGSPNCRKVHAVIDHLDLEVQFEYRDFFTGELRLPEYLDINPNAMVPTLVDGDLVLWESNAIIQYLADRGLESALFPRDPKRRADIARWQHWELAHFNKAFGVLAFEAVAKPNFLNAQPDAGLVRWSQGELARFAQVLNRALEGRDYLVGDSITLADYAVIHLEGFKSAVPFDWQPYENLNAYFSRMAAVPHWMCTAPSSPQAIGRRPGSVPAAAANE